MATRDELLALAERCEREEPSSDLDVGIAAACGIQWDYDEGGNFPPYRILPMRVRFTTSLDAAVTLVPDGMNFGIEFDANANHPGGATVADFRLADVPERYGRAKTPALALCAAALRARAAMEAA